MTQYSFVVWLSFMRGLRNKQEIPVLLWGPSWFSDFLQLVVIDYFGA